MDKNNESNHDLRNYIIGFVLSVVLCAAAFWVVLGADFSRNHTMSLVGILGIAQLFVQFRYFLHINGRRENREDFYLIHFSFLVLLIMVLGTIWVLGNLANRMGM